MSFTTQAIFIYAVTGHGRHATSPVVVTHYRHHEYHILIHAINTTNTSSTLMSSHAIFTAHTHHRHHAIAIVVIDTIITDVPARVALCHIYAYTYTALRPWERNAQAGKACHADRHMLWCVVPLLFTGRLRYCLRQESTPTQTPRAYVVIYNAISCASLLSNIAANVTHMSARKRRMAQRHVAAARGAVTMSERQCRQVTRCCARLLKNKRGICCYEGYAADNVSRYANITLPRCRDGGVAIRYYEENSIYSPGNSITTA